MTMLRSTRTRQPAMPLPIGGSRLADGLAYFFHGARGDFDAVRSRPPVGGTRMYAPGQEGLAFAGNGSSRVIDLGGLVGIARLTEGATLMAVVEMPTLGVAASTICSFVDGAAVRSVSMHANDGSASNLVAGGYNNVSTWTAFVTPNNLVAGRRYVLIATYNANTTLQTFEVNDLGTTTAAITYALGESCSIGARRTAPSTYNSYFNGLIYAVGLWQRQLSRGERSALAANPWQLFDAPRRLGAIFEAGGVTVYRPGSDLIVNGWTAVGAASLAAAMADASDATYAQSPSLTAPATEAWDATLPAGTYDIAVKFDRTDATGQLRMVLLNGPSTVVGTSAWQAAPAGAATTTFNMTISGPSDRFRIEVQP